MKPRRITTGLLLLVSLAFLGFGLMYVPQQIASHYQAVRDAGPVWVALYLIAVGLGTVLFVGCAIWVLWRLWSRTRQKAARRGRRDKSPRELTLEEREREIEENLQLVTDLQDESPVAAEVRRQLEPIARELQRKRQAQTLEIVAFGTISSGKSSLLNALAGREAFATDARGGTTLRRNEVPWPGVDRVTLVDTPGLGEVEGAAHAEVSAEAAGDADIVLLVVDGPLRDSEYQLLERLGRMEKRVLLCLNKEDWYEPPERGVLLDQLAAQAKDWIERADVVAVSALPVHRRRVRVRADGSEVEEAVEVPPDIGGLAQRMMEVIHRDGRDLLLANLLLRSRGLLESARARVEAALDERAWEIVNRSMWGAGGAAALSPLPLVDLVAGSAVSVKMVVDLAAVYRQDVDLQVAVRMLGQLGKNLLSILGVSAVTPAVTAAVASLLKTVPGAGTIAGGALQGVVQALVTRWIGGVFIVYFKNEMKQPEGGLAGLARREWRKATTAAELGELLQSARRHYQGDSSSR